MSNFIRIIKISLLLSLFIYQTSIACTSYTVSLEKNMTLYGMNFDYNPQAPIRFLIKNGKIGKVFHLAFIKGTTLAMTAGMNSQGLFANIQMLYPEDLSGWPHGPGTNYFWEVYEEALSGYERVSDLHKLINQRRLVQGYGVTLHSMFADRQGDALIVEAGHENNKIVTKRGKFLIMANFPSSDFTDTLAQDVKGVGADRYKIARNYLRQHTDTFNVDKAMALLMNAINLHSSFPTRCSLVFNPEQALVYIALESDFTKIWRLSIKKSIIETWQGFRTHKLWELGPNGLMTNELQLYEK